MIELHYFRHSRSHRVLWFLEELQVSYNLVIHDRDPETQLAPKSAKQIHPLGKFPIVIDNGLVLAESAVILEYLARSYGGPDWVYESSDSEYWSFQYWMHYAEASLMPPLIIRLVLSVLKGEQIPLMVRPISRRLADGIDRNFTKPQITSHFEFVDKHLASHFWFVGDHISIADVQMHFPLEAALAKSTIRPEQYPNVASYVSRIHERPAYQRALEKAGGYDFGPRDDT